MKKLNLFLMICLLTLLYGCQKKTYLLQFYDIDGELCTKKYVDEGKYTIVEIAPKADGYMFDGWMLDGRIVEELDVHSDLDIQSSYSAISYTISTDELEQYVEVGEETSLRWKIEPEGYSGKVDVFCSDEGVVEVHADGSCIGLKEGEAVVTVEIDNGAVEFVVLVIDPDMDPVHDPKKGFRLTSEEFVHLDPGDTYQICIETDMGDLVYSSDDEAIAKVSESGLIKAKGYGSTAVRASTKDGNYGAMTFVYVDGHEIDASLAEPDRIYHAGEFIETYLNYVHYEDGRVSTTNGVAEDYKVIIEEGPDVLEVRNRSLYMVEPYEGTIKIRFEIDGTRSNSVTVNCGE